MENRYQVRYVCDQCLNDGTAFEPYVWNERECECLSMGFSAGKGLINRETLSRSPETFEDFPPPSGT